MTGVVKLREIWIAVVVVVVVYLRLGGRKNILGV
jgi:hypothetical protein